MLDRGVDRKSVRGWVGGMLRVLPTYRRNVVQIVCLDGGKDFFLDTPLSTDIVSAHLSCRLISYPAICIAAASQSASLATDRAVFQVWEDRTPNSIISPQDKIIIRFPATKLAEAYSLQPSRGGILRRRIIRATTWRVAG